LKPDVCRRMVGRRPTPSLERMCWRPHAPKSRGLSCEIARIFTRAIPLTTGTFNLIVKDRTAVLRGQECPRYTFRLSGAYSVQNESARVAWTFLSAPRHKSVCPRNPLKLLSALHQSQPIVPTGFPPVLHN